MTDPAPPDLRPFNEKLRAWKDRTKISLPAAAELFLVSRATLARYLSGSSVPHPWLQGMILAAAEEHERKMKADA